MPLLLTNSWAAYYQQEKQCKTQFWEGGQERIWHAMYTIHYTNKNNTQLNKVRLLKIL